MRQELCQDLVAEGLDPFPRGDDAPQAAPVRLWQAVLRAAGDPDWKVSDVYAVGVPLGVGVKLSRTQRCSNARCVGVPRVGEAAQVGSGGDPLGAVAQGPPAGGGVHRAGGQEGVRGPVGGRLLGSDLEGRQAGRDRGPSPLARRHVRVSSQPARQGAGPAALADLLGHQADAEGVGASSEHAFAITADGKEAHRIDQVRAEGWPLQACQPREGGTVFLNTCGTSGLQVLRIGGGDWAGLR